MSAMNPEDGVPNPLGKFYFLPPGCKEGDSILEYASHLSGDLEVVVGLSPSDPDLPVIVEWK